MTEESNEKRKSVVVLGGGHAGVAAAGVLSEQLDPAKYTLTLINDRPFLILYPATARLTVSDQHDLGNQPFIPYDNIFKKNGTFMLGTAVAIKKLGTGGEVVLQDETKVAFDVLVLATGNHWEGALDFPETTEKIDKWLQLHRKRVADAKEIVLVGGGAVGSGAFFLFELEHPLTGICV
jgi:NADH dehydrogenase FAD-containing subunit